VRHNDNEEFLAVDVGEKRIGIARGASAARLAEPLKTVDSQTAIAEIRRLAKEYSADGIVVGLPRSLEGGETTQTKSVRDWAGQAKKQIELPFYWQDEALTSLTAEKAGGDDSHAAAIILQDFLDSPPDQRVRY
jgi:putative Holliday junction resolvase